MRVIAGPGEEDAVVVGGGGEDHGHHVRVTPSSATTWSTPTDRQIRPQTWRGIGYTISLPRQDR